MCKFRAVQSKIEGMATSVRVFFEHPSYEEGIKFTIRQADPYDKTKDPTKGGRGAKFTLPKHFVINYFHM